MKKYQERPSEEEKVDVEPAHLEQEGMNQAKAAKGETEHPRPTSSLVPSQQTGSSSPLQQMGSPRPTQNVRLPK